MRYKLFVLPFAVGCMLLALAGPPAGKLPAAAYSGATERASVASDGPEANSFARRMTSDFVGSMLAAPVCTPYWCGSDPACLTPVLRFHFEGTGP